MEKHIGMPAEGVSVVVPTFSESGSVAELVRRLAAVLDAGGLALRLRSPAPESAQAAAEVV